MPGHPRRHEGFPGATGCLAAAPAGPGGDGDGHVLLHPPADVLDELLGDFPGARVYLAQGQLHYTGYAAHGERVEF